MENNRIQTTNLITEAPVVKVSTADSARHLIGFDGVMMLNGRTRSGYACEIWAILEDQTTFTYLSTENQSPCVVNYSPSVIGKTVAYRLRWIDNLGNTGSWSETISKEIT
jgi:hypothetical protein